MRTHPTGAWLYNASVADLGGGGKMFYARAPFQGPTWENLESHQRP